MLGLSRYTLGGMPGKKENNSLFCILDVAFQDSMRVMRPALFIRGSFNNLRHISSSRPVYSNRTYIHLSIPPNHAALGFEGFVNRKVFGSVVGHPGKQPFQCIRSDWHSVWWDAAKVPVASGVPSLSMRSVS